ERPHLPVAHGPHRGLVLERGDSSAQTEREKHQAKPHAYARGWSHGRRWHEAGRELIRVGVKRLQIDALDSAFGIEPEHLEPARPDRPLTRRWLAERGGGLRVRTGSKQREAEEQDHRNSWHGSASHGAPSWRATSWCR